MMVIDAEWPDFEKTIFLDVFEKKVDSFQAGPILGVLLYGKGTVNG